MYGAGASPRKPLPGHSLGGVGGSPPQASGRSRPLKRGQGRVCCSLSSPAQRRAASCSLSFPSFLKQAFSNPTLGVVPRVSGLAHLLPLTAEQGRDQLLGAEHEDEAGRGSGGC